MTDKDDCFRFLSFQVIPLCFFVFFKCSYFRHKSVMVRDIFMQFHGNMFLVRTKCHA